MPTETLTPGQDWTVPDGVFAVTLTLEGEAGEDDEFEPPGDGGRVVGTRAVTPGQTLRARSSSGGASDAADGGDSVDVRIGGTTLSDRIAVAAGGGGPGSAGTYGDAGDAGGDGGPDTGESASGSGGTQTDGGTGGGDGDDGTFGDGGDGGASEPFSGGGGGAGWYGGGGGASTDSTAGGQGGGGGSNNDDGLDTVTANERGTSSRTYGEGGLVTIEYEVVRPQSHTIDAVDATSIAQSWDAVTDADEYELYRAESAGVDTSDTLATTTTNTSDTDTGLPNGREYHYRVRAIINGEPSALSDEVQATTDLPAPQIDGVTLT